MMELPFKVNFYSNLSFQSSFFIFSCNDLMIGNPIQYFNLH